MNGFSSSKQAIIKELVGPGTKYETFSSYMNGLEDDDKKKLNDISDEGLRIYITEQAEKGKVIASKPLNNEKVNSPTMEQIANGIQVENFATDLKTIKAKYPDVAWSTEEGNKIAYERMSPKQQKLLDEKYGGNKEKMYMALGIAEDMKIIEKNNLTKEMTKEEQQKYNALVKRYYEYNESIGLGEFLKETW